MAATLDHTPARQPFANGETLLDGFIALVPRILWPEKPFALGGSAFMSRYTGIRFDGDVSISTNYLFEFYVNFGLPGVTIGMFFLGICIAALEALFYQYCVSRPYVEWTVFMSMWTVCVTADNVASVMMTLPATAAIGYGLQFLTAPMPASVSSCGVSRRPSSQATFRRM